MSASGEFGPGDVIARRYRVQALLGEGGFGAVYRAVNQENGALGHAHALGIVHRDIKPANIFLCAGRDTDFARIIDFGIAKALRPENQNLTRLTVTGQIIGTPHYMAPEQVQGATIGPAAD